jgi:hypothetical protein
MSSIMSIHVSYICTSLAAIMTIDPVDGNGDSGLRIAMIATSLSTLDFTFSISLA